MQQVAWNKECSRCNFECKKNQSGEDEYPAYSA